MARSIFTDIDAAKEEAIYLQQENNETFSLVEAIDGFWVTRKCYAKRIKAKIVWDTVGKSPRAKNSPRYWSDDEKQLIIDTYAKDGGVSIAVRTGKTLDSIHSMAATLSVSRYKKTAQ